jgi:hypothetical protein
MEYTEQLITPCATGFGEYEQNHCDFEDWWADRNDLERAMLDGIGGGLLWSLDDPDLPDYVKDIRGAIHNQEGDIYAIGHEDDNPDGSPNITYCAIVERAEMRR